MMVKLFVLMCVMVIVAHGEICFTNATDIYKGFNSSMASGSMVPYGNGLLILADDGSGYHLFTYSEGRQEKLKKFDRFYEFSHILHVEPFDFLFEPEEEKALFQIFNANDPKNVTLYYTSGSIDNPVTRTVHSDEYTKRFQRWQNNLYTIGRTKLYQFDIGAQNPSLTEIPVPGCEYTKRLENLNDEYFVLVCVNDTEYSEHALTSLYFMNLTGNFEYNNMSGLVLPYPFNDFSELFIVHNNELYFYAADPSNNVESGIYKIEDHRSKPELVYNGTHLLFPLGDNLYFVEILRESGKYIRIVMDETREIFRHTYAGSGYYLHNNYIYFYSDCLPGQLGNFYMCAWDLENNQVTAVPRSNVTYGIHDFFEFKGKLYFVATDEKHGTEVFTVTSGNLRVESVSDIYRGPRSSRPDTFIPLGQDKIYFIAQNIYIGREIFVMYEDDNCPDSNTTGIIVGDVSTENTDFTNINIVEGNVFGQGDFTLRSLTVLGTVNLGSDSNITVGTDSQLNVRGCIYSQNSSLYVTLTPEELASGNVNLLRGTCIVGDFDVTINDTCYEVVSVEQENGQGLSVSFQLTPACGAPQDDLITMIFIICAVAVLVIVLLLVVLFIPPVRRRIFPYWNRKDRAKKMSTANTKRESDTTTSTREEKLSNRRKKGGVSPA